MARFRYWLPSVFWMACIFFFSTDVFAAPHTGGVLAGIIQALFGHPIPAWCFDLLHEGIRKCAHVTVYAILGALLFRSLRAERSGWKWSWAVTAMILAVLYAASDEWHQSFVPSRTASAVDVLWDALGAFLAQAVIRLRCYSQRL